MSISRAAFVAWVASNEPGVTKDDAGNLVITGRPEGDFIVEIGSEELNGPFREVLDEVQRGRGRRLDEGALYWAVLLDILETTGTAHRTGHMVVRLVGGDFQVVTVES